MKTSLKVRKCACCREPFMQQRPLQSLCSPPCAVRDAEARHARRVAAQKRQERQSDRARKVALKKLRELLAEAQTAFNEFVRLRDSGQPCICCGQQFEPDKPGGSVDAGHFRSRAAAPQLRFNENNVFAQRKNCNRPGGTTYAAFRAGVVARIGEPAVQALEADNTTHKWSKDEVRAIRDTYRAKVRALRRQTDFSTTGERQ